MVNENPETVLILGDTHGSFGFLSKALMKLAKPENAVVHVVGDFGYWPQVKGGQHFLKELEDLCDSLDVLVTFTDGNHEDHSSLHSAPVDEDGWRRISPHVWHAPRGHDWYWGNTHFFALGGASSIDGPNGPDWWKRQFGQGRGPIKSGSLMANVYGPVLATEDVDLGWWDPDELISEEDVENCLDKIDGLDDVDIMFAHDCPSRISIPTIDKTYPESEENRNRLRKVWGNLGNPDLIHGHYHVFHDTHRNKESSRVIGLAHDGARTHNYCWIRTEETKIIVPEWNN